MSSLDLISHFKSFTIENNPVYHTKNNTCVIHMLDSKKTMKNQIVESKNIVLPKYFEVKKKKKTKWEEFAEKKGISARKKEDKLVYCEERKEWLRRYDRGGINDIEVNRGKGLGELKSISQLRKQKKDNVSKNKRSQKYNQKRNK